MPVEQSERTVASQGHEQLIAHWLGAVVWNVLAVPILFLLLGGEGAEQPTFIRWVLIGFVGIGVLILANALVYTARVVRFRNLRLELDPFPGSIGGQVGGSVELPVRPGGQMQARATLNCIHSYMRGSGENRNRREDVVWSAQVVPDVEGSASGARLRFVFDVPDVGQPDSEEREGDHHYWSIHLAAELPGADLDQSFVVPVRSLDPPLQASRPFDPPRDDGRDLARQGIDLERTAQGVRIHYRRGRYGLVPHGLLLFGTLCIASGSFIFGQTSGSTSGIGALFTAFGGLFLVVFGLVGLLLLVLALQMLLNSLTVELGSGTIRSTRSYLLFRWAQEAPMDHLQGIEAKVTMQSGQGAGARTGYSLEGRVAGGQRIALGDGIRGAYLLDRIRAVLEEETGVAVDVRVRKRLGSRG